MTTTTSATPVAQVDNVSLVGTVETGDVYSVVVDGTTVNYTVQATDTTIDDVRNGLVNAINNDPTVSSIVTAAAGGAGALTLTADTAGTSFSATANATNNGATADNTATRSAGTPNGASTTTSAATSLTFDANGELTSPTSLSLALTFAGGTSANVALDISNMTQFYGDFLPVSYTKNGFASSNMKSFSFNETGDVYGSFEDNTTRPIYKLALSVFSNPNGLEAVNGNVFKLTPESGEATTVTAGSSGYAYIMPNARELANVDIADEFSKMMMTQTAYNAASTVFRTTDEMTTVARDLKK